MTEEEIENELEIFEAKVEKLITEFGEKTDICIGGLYIEYVADEKDNILPIVYASLEDPEEEYAVDTLDVTRYGSRETN